MWAEQAVFYQISTLGFCGAPAENDGILVDRILKVRDFIPHMKALSIGAVYFCPVFDSDRHGYDTRDYRRIDPRLGSSEDFAAVCAALHENGIRVVLDGVFNHVGRGFFAFTDLLEKREASRYKDWFVNVRFDCENGYHDGLCYEGWEGHYELVKLNLRNEEVIAYLLESVNEWIDRFSIDGLRLDVAYCLDMDFIRRLRAFTKEKRRDFFLLGEMIHGDYARLLAPELLDCVTNYQAYKGIWSSLNDLNLFEINYTLEQQFCGRFSSNQLLDFAENHDVNRLWSTLKDPAQLWLAYALLFCMPGIPCLYYGGEWSQSGKKEEGGDAALRPYAQSPHWTPLCEKIACFSSLYAQQAALYCGCYRKLFLTNRQLVFERCAGDERILFALNADEQEAFASFFADAEHAVDLFTGESIRFENGALLPPYSAFCWKVG